MKNRLMGMRLAVQEFGNLMTLALDEMEKVTVKNKFVEITEEDAREKMESHELWAVGPDFVLDEDEIVYFLPVELGTLYWVENRSPRA